MYNTLLVSGVVSLSRRMVGETMAEPTTRVATAAAPPQNLVLTEHGVVRLKGWKAEAKMGRALVLAAWTRELKKGMDDSDVSYDVPNVLVLTRSTPGQRRCANLPFSSSVLGLVLPLAAGELEGLR